MNEAASPPPMIAAYYALRARVVLSGLFFAIGLIATYAKQGMVILLILTLAAQPGVMGALGAARSYSRDWTVRIGIILAAWMVVSLFWTPHPDFDVLRVLLMPVMGLLLVNAVHDLPESDVARVARWAMIGGIIMLVSLALEIWSGGAFLRIGAPDWGPIPPGQTHPMLEIASRGTAILAPLTFAYAHMLHVRTGRFIWPALFVAGVLAVCGSSSIDAAWVAVMFGLTAFGVSLRAPRFALAALFGGLIIYAASAPVISSTVLTPATVGGNRDAALVGMESRIGIWHKASQLIAEKPVLGHGFDSTRVLAKAAEGERTPGTPWLALPLHTHNAVLQIWLELGAVGIAIVIAMLAAAARALWRFTDRPRDLAVILATVTATAFLILTSYGVWQHWWIATWLFAAALTVLALRVVRPSSASLSKPAPIS